MNGSRGSLSRVLSYSFAPSSLMSALRTQTDKQNQSGGLITLSFTRQNSSPRVYSHSDKEDFFTDGVTTHWRPHCDVKNSRFWSRSWAAGRSRKPGTDGDCTKLGQVRHSVDNIKEAYHVDSKISSTVIEVLGCTVPSRHIFCNKYKWTMSWN